MLLRDAVLLLLRAALYESRIMNLEAILCARPTLAVWGDLMLDEWIEGDATRISPEAPVPVVRFGRRKLAPGGAANVAAGLLALGARARVGGLVGRDEAGRDLTRELEHAALDTRAIVAQDGRPTTLKTRVVAGRQQLVRIDRESVAPPDAAATQRLLHALPALLEGAGALILSDYAKGLAGGAAWAELLSAARAAGVLITGGPKPANLQSFGGADLISLNQSEAEAAWGGALAGTTEVEAAGAELLRRAQVKALAITRGAAGVALFQAGKAPFYLAAHRVEVFDVAGAGDTFLAGATFALAAGAALEEAVEFGNLAAACSVKHVGVVAITPAEIRALAQN